MSRVSTALAAVLAVGAVLVGGAAADSSSFSETQSPDDQLFHIDVGASYLNVGQPPRDQNSGVGTIKISLPGAQARFDPAASIDQPGYSCSATTSAYGDPNSGFICSTGGQVQGAGLQFPTAVTVHLLSQNCYAPPPQGSAQPAIAQVWAAPGDPGTPPDATFPLYADISCDTGVQTPVDVIAPLNCIVPKLGNLPLKKATAKLKSSACRRGKVKFAASKRVKKGRVVSQSPKPGKKLKGNAKVNLIVSRGPR